MSLKQNNNELSRLVGAAIAVLIALPIAAWVGSFIGDSYTARATAYILILAWSVLGAGILCFITRNSTKPVTAVSLILWIISVWVWPILLLVYWQKNKTKSGAKNFGSDSERRTRFLLVRLPFYSVCLYLFVHNILLNDRQDIVDKPVKDQPEAKKINIIPKTNGIMAIILPGQDQEGSGSV